MNCKNKINDITIVLSVKTINRSNFLLNEIKNIVDNDKIIILCQNIKIAEQINKDKVFNVILKNENETLASARNRCVTKIKTQYVLFITDNINAKCIENVFELLCLLKGNNTKIHAISPMIKLKQSLPVYQGDFFSESLFYGYENRFDPTKLSVEEHLQCADTLGNDCFIIDVAVLDLVGGFSDWIEEEYISTIELCCKMKKLGFTCAFAPSIIIDLHDKFIERKKAFGRDIVTLLSLHGELFRESSVVKNRGVICSENWDIPKNNKGFVLMVTHELSRTGAPVVIIDMAKQLHKMGFSVMFVSRLHGELEKNILQEGFPLLWDNEMMRDSEVTERLIDISNPILLDSLIGAFDYTVFNTLVTYNILTRYNGMKHKIFWWIHEGHHYWNYILPKLPQKLASNIKVLAVSNYVLYEMRQAGFEGKVEVLEYGVEDVYNKINQKKLALSGRQDSVKFLIAGAIQLRKGQDIFICALQNLPAKYQEQIDVYFVGSPIEYDITEKVNNFVNKNSYAHDLKTMSREDLFSLYKEVDALVLPSRDDPMPVVATENMMLEGVCICSDKTGTACYIEDKANGLVFESENINELTECLIYVIDNKDKLAGMGRNARKIFLEFFESSVFYKSLENLFIPKE